MRSADNRGEMAILRSGIDMVEVDRLEGLRPGIRARFLARIFTPHELADAGKSDASLLGLFAAKEAVAKALGSGIGKVAWKEIEIRKDRDGAPKLHLQGRAKQMAERLGLRLWSVSISHSRTHAVAVAVAMGSTTEADK